MNSVLKSVYKQFEELCKKNEVSPHPTNRFLCMNQLDQGIQKHCGAYTEDVRRDTLDIMYTCLCAPNFYFGKQQEPSRKENKRIVKYIGKHDDFMHIWESERICESAMCAYIDGVRKYYARKQNFSSKREEKNPYADGLRKSLALALQDRVKEIPRLENVVEKYQKTLHKIFSDEQESLNNPIFFLFLPYYVFFELAKCEGIIQENSSVFSFIQLAENKLNWSIRSNPFRGEEIDPEQVISLYKMVERILCQELQEQEYSSVGRDLWLTGYDYPDSDQCTDAKIKEKLIADAIDFSVPFLLYSKWADMFINGFSNCKIDRDKLEMDICKLLSLELRCSKQAHRGQAEILQEYKKYEVCLRKHRFVLSELLSALCLVYSLNSINEKQKSTNNLCSAIELLTGFLITYGRADIATIDAPVEDQRLYLIQEGFPYMKSIQTSGSSDGINYYLRCPSRILFVAAYMHWYMGWLEKPRRYILIDTIPYSASLEKISNALYHALCSEKELLRDISVWGGVEVSLDDDYVRSMNEAFHVWSLWHSNEAKIYKELEQYLKTSPDILNKIAEGLKETSSNFVELDLSDYGFDEENTQELLNAKKSLLCNLGPLKDKFGDPEYLSDFRYTMILYRIFQALRDQMYVKAYNICTKIWDSRFSPPLMFRTEAFDAMLEENDV